MLEQLLPHPESCSQPSRERRFRFAVRKQLLGRMIAGGVPLALSPLLPEVLFLLQGTAGELAHKLRYLTLQHSK